MAYMPVVAVWAEIVCFVAIIAVVFNHGVVSLNRCFMGYLPLALLLAAKGRLAHCSLSFFCGAESSICLVPESNHEPYSSSRLAMFGYLPSSNPS